MTPALVQILVFSFSLSQIVLLKTGYHHITDVPCRAEN
jgi:hypothetical protein